MSPTALAQSAIRRPCPPAFCRWRALLLAAGLAVAGCAQGGSTGVGLDLVAPEQVRELGLETWQRIRAERPVSSNRSYQQALQRVGSRLLATAGENPGNWEMVVFRGDEANAFALPGGKIGVYEGMFNYARNEAQLAAVVAHEISHNLENHAGERLSSSIVSQIGMQALGAALQAGNVGNANQIAALLGAGVEFGLILPYSRNQELEADARGLNLMARAGYDPREAINVWINMEGSGPRPPEFASTHPSPGSRIGQLEQLMPEALALYTG